MEKLQQELKELYKQIESCEGFQGQQLWARVGDIKKQIKNLQKITNK